MGPCERPFTVERCRGTGRATDLGWCNSEPSRGDPKQDGNDEKHDP